MGKRKVEWTVLALPEALWAEKYNYVIRGYLTYYAPVVDYPLGLQYLHYLFTYSCAHTLANQLNCRISDIFKKFGKKNITIKYKTKTEVKDKLGNISNEEKENQISLISWDEFTL